MKFTYTYQSSRHCLLNKKREWRDANLATHTEDFPRITTTPILRSTSGGSITNRQMRRKVGREKR